MPFIGDSLGDDVFGPKALGMKAVWLNRKGKIYSDSVSSFPTEKIYDPDCIIDTLAKLPEVIVEMNQ